MSTVRALVAIVVCALGSLVWATPASADGIEKKADPYVYRDYNPQYVPYDWSGAYFGGHAGGAYTASEWNFTNPLERIEDSTTGFAGGGHVGIQKQWGALVFGAEVSYTWIGAEESSASAIVPNTTFASETKDLLLITGKVGYAYENMLAYAKGGFATADMTFTTRATDTGAITTRTTGREQGWTAGLGLEYAVRPHIILGVEYDYMRIESATRDQLPGSVPPTQVTDAGVDIQMLVARLSVKLGPH
jgi:outer membrane immunogenic protein